MIESINFIDAKFPVNLMNVDKNLCDLVNFAKPTTSKICNLCMCILQIN